MLLTFGCAVNPVSGDQDFVLMSEKQETALGSQYSKQVLRQIPAYPDERLQEYVQKIGDSLANNSHRSELIYRFTVLDSPDVNAFALPGGYIFIFRGLMAYLSTEEELAAVLGHELGHVTARHSVQQISQSQLFDILTTVVRGQASSNIYNITNLAKGAFLAGYGRKLELQADELGAEYLVLDGYSYKGMLKTLSVLKDQELYSKEVSVRRGQTQQTYHGVFASHPKNDKRFQEIIEKAKSIEDISSKDPNGKFLNLIEGMTYGDSESAGVRRGSNFYHKKMDLHLRAPHKWEIVNTPSELIFTSPKGEATLSLQVNDQHRAETAREYLKRNVESDLYEEKELNINGYKAATAVIKRAGKSFRLAVVFKNRNVFLFTGLVKENSGNFSFFDKEFVSIINSFSNLKEAEKSLALPLKIKLHKVKRGESYNSLSLQSPIPFDPETKLRLLNGDYPDDPLRVGRIIKIVK